MNVYRVVVPDITYDVDVGSDWFKMPELETACCLVLAETNAKARYRGLLLLGLAPRDEGNWPEKMSCVCMRNNVDFPGMHVGMDVTDHTEWWDKENETREVQREAMGKGDLC
jgi:hypothetical protein